MASAFAWFNNLIETFATIIPRLVHVRATYVCAVYGLAGKVEIKQPGLFWYWPVIARIRMIPTTVRTFTYNGLAVERKTGPWGVPITVCAGALVEARVVDAAKMIHHYDMPATVEASMIDALTQAWDDHEYASTLMRDILADAGIELCTFAVVDIYERLTVGEPPERFMDPSTEGDTDMLPGGSRYTK